ncbi:hypothetical protein MACK_000801 [Theileria orientalis]|uniref:Uncharacterized protein n=1 Tax=Theileria orientalis TaxID=68886 RepID=A0A976QTH7_THEOR|nr:hypothetical protein MACK_000801 [Theileria orientalis]
MLNKCVKLILILALVVAVAFGVSFLPFSLSDKFKQVAEKVTSHIKGLAGLNKNAGAKLNLDFSKRDNYKLGEFNVVFDKVNNVPKEGFHKFVHKGENDATLDVEKFFNGETELEGLEGGLFDYAAAYFKGDTPHLLLVELGLHEEEKQENADKAGEKKEGEAKAGENKENAAAEEKKGAVWFFAPGENNKWVKLAEGANLGEKVEEVFNALAAAAAAAPANTTPEGGNGAAAGGAPPAEGAGAAAAAGPGEGPAPAGVQAGGNAAPSQAPVTPVPAAKPGPGSLLHLPLKAVTFQMEVEQEPLLTKEREIPEQRETQAQLDHREHLARLALVPVQQKQKLPSPFLSLTEHLEPQDYQVLDLEQQTPKLHKALVVMLPSEVPLITHKPVLMPMEIIRVSVPMLTMAELDKGSVEVHQDRQQHKQPALAQALTLSLPRPQNQ